MARAGMPSRTAGISGRLAARACCTTAACSPAGSSDTMLSAPVALNQNGETSDTRSRAVWTVVCPVSVVQ